MIEDDYTYITILKMRYLQKYKEGSAMKTFIIEYEDNGKRVSEDVQSETMLDAVREIESRGIEPLAAKEKDTL